MRDALAYEWTRIRTLRSTWWITGVVLVLGVAISGLVSWGIDSDEDKLGPFGALEELGGAIVTQLAATGEIPSLVSYLIAVIGVLAWGHEYRHGMVRASLTAISSRSSFWVAKHLVVALWVAATVFATAVASGLVAMVFVSDWLTVFSGLTWRVIGREVLYAVLLTLLAMGFTAVTRSQVLAIVALFLWPMLIEPLLHLIFLLVPALDAARDLLRFLPFGAGRRMLSLLEQADSTFGDPLSVLGGTIVFGGTAATLLVASYVLFLRRDA